MDILFLNPPRSRRADDHVLDTAMLWLATQLRGEGCEVAVRLPSGDRLEEDVVEALRECSPRYVAVACKWWSTLYGALEVASAVRRARPDLPIVTGGHTASVFCREIVATGLVDVVLLGDVDRSLPDLVRRGQIRHGLSAQGYHPELGANGRRGELDSVSLAPIAALTDRVDAVPGYVWTGRGCAHSCFYCLENRESGREVLGRRGPTMRPVEAVAGDLEALAGRTQLIFDYEHPSGPKTLRFLGELFRRRPASFASCYYFHWGLPGPELLELLSASFEQAAVCLDIQAFSEPHRNRLAAASLIKPARSDAEIIDVLEKAEALGNVHVDATGLLGMPFESDDDRVRALGFIEELSGRFRCVRDWRFSPLHVIPGTPLAKEEEFFDLQVVRRGFDDFLAFTREAYLEEIPYYSRERSSHPYGVFPRGLPEAIIDFQASAEKRLGAAREAKRRVEVQRGAGGARLRIEDPFSPLETLFDSLEALAGAPGAPRRLELELGPRTWFHGSWLDYTSESGENSATVLGVGREVADLENALAGRLGFFDRVGLSAAGTWGVVESALADQVQGVA